MRRCVLFLIAGMASALVLALGMGIPVAQASPGPMPRALVLAQARPGPVPVAPSVPRPHDGRALPASDPTYDENCNVFGECLNDWNNSGEVSTYTKGVDNNAYLIQGIDRCGNGYDSTANCPIEGMPADYFIFQFKDQRTGKCIGLAASGSPYPLETGCNNPSTGYGGGDGTVNILAYSSGCPSDYYLAINSYWSNYYGGWGDIVGYNWGSSDHDPVYLNDGTAVCFQEFTFSG
jgi:hypothetical protein